MIGIILFLVCPSLGAQPITLVKDIAPAQVGTAARGPEEFLRIGGTVYFSGYDPANGRELWRTDGTPAGTQLVRDIQPGPGSSVPRYLTSAGGTLYFTAFDGFVGFGLWRSDGTPTGTQLLRGAYGPDVPVGGGYGYTVSMPEQLVDAGSRLYFGSSAVYQPKTFELWVSDGSAAGTVALNSPGMPHFSDGSLGTDPLWGRPYGASLGGGKFLFVRQDLSLGTELYESDGTIQNSGTGGILVKDIRPGTVGSSPSELTSFHGHVYFYADDGVSGRELWRSDGTPLGTTRVVDACPGSCGMEDVISLRMSPLGHLVAAGTNLFFAATNSMGGAALWKTDGTPGGTAMVKDMPDPGIWPRSLTSAGGLVYFVASGGAGNSRALWRSDGTDTGTFPVITQDVHQDIQQTLVADSGTGLYYLEWEQTAGSIGTRLWKTDGSVAGSIPLRSFGPIPDRTGALAASIGDSLVFGADDGSGMALWVSDGTPQGTQVLKRLDPGQCNGPGGTLMVCGSSAPLGETDLLGTLLFSASDEQLWRSDGSPAGTTALADLSADCQYGYCPAPMEPTASGSHLFFALDRPGGPSLWASDATGSGTQQILGADRGQPPSSLTEGGGPLFFQTSSGGSNGLWTSDGSAAGTTFVAPFPAGSPVPNPTEMVRLGTTLFMASGTQFWRSDGTAPGTTLVADLSPSVPRNLAPVGGMLLFSASPPYGYDRLWRSDGTAAGTTLVSDALFAGLRNVTPVGNALFFTDWEYLWRSDGTAQGTFALPTLECCAYVRLQAEQLTDLDGSVLLFTGWDAASGRELWRSDGTPEGTLMVKDLNPGPEGSAISEMRAIGGGRALFSASDPAHGRELWITDGTAAGTGRVQDTAAGPSSSSPSSIAVSGTRAFLTADDGVVGSELWALDLSGPVVDLGVTMSAAPEPVLPGQLLTYTVTVTNLGDATAHGVALTDRLPAGLAFASATPPCQWDGVTLACAMGTMPPQTTATLVITGTVTISSGPLTNVASVVSTELDFPPDNNTAVVTSSVNPADLAVSLVASPSAVPIGGTLTYTMTITDNGPAAATDVRGFLDLPPLAGVVSATPGPPVCLTPYDVVTCSFGGLSPGSSVTATVTVQVQGGTLATSTASTRGTSFDSDPSNDSVSLSTPVTGYRNELVHGSSEIHELTGPPNQACGDFYRFGLPPRTSAEVVVDGAAGGMFVSRYASDGYPSLGSGYPISAGSSLAMRWENTGAVPDDGDLIDVGSPYGCDSTPLPYQIRAYDTTARIARFNNSGTQDTVLLLVNPNPGPFGVQGHVWFWDGAGTLLASRYFSLGPHGLYALDTKTVSVLQGMAGSITVTSNGGYGALTGKAVSLEAATGFSFDTPLLARPR